MARRTARPSEMASALALIGRLPTAITRYPSGKFGLVGSIPGALTREADPKATPQWPPARRSMIWDTEAEVIAALLAIGVTRFQLADCTWYQGVGQEG